MSTLSRSIWKTTTIHLHSTSVFIVTQGLSNLCHSIHIVSRTLLSHIDHFAMFSCLSKIGDPRSLKLNYFLFFMPSVSTSPEILTLDSHFILSQTIIQPIRITANPGRDAKVYTGAISRKRPRSESGAFEKQNIKRERNSIDDQGENFKKRFIIGHRLLSDFYFWTGSFGWNDRKWILSRTKLCESHSVTGSINLLIFISERIAIF